MSDTPRQPRYRPFGKYQPIRKLAVGVVGITYLAEGPSGEPVVLKLLYDRIARVEHRLVRFYQEAKLAMEIEDPHVVRTLEVGFRDGRHFIAMALAPGDSLRTHVATNGPLSEQQALHVAQQLARGAAALHQRGIIHRDLNPDNAIIDARGHVVLVDLGLAKDMAIPLDLTIDGGGLGNPQYIAPEQFRDAKHVGPAADSYGLAATLSFLLTAAPPFPGESPAAALFAKLKSPYRLPEPQARTVSAATRALLCRAMSRSPDKRPECMATFGKHLARCSSRLQRAAAAPAPAPEAIRRGLCTVVTVSETGQLVRREATEAQVARWIKSGELTPDARIASANEPRFLPLAETTQFGPLFRRPARTARARSWLATFTGKMGREVVALARGFWKSLRNELKIEPDTGCGVGMK